MTRYTYMPIGRVRVLLIYDDTGLLCVQRNKWDARKLKLNSYWWRFANGYLKNTLKPAIEAKTFTVTNITVPARIMAAGALKALCELLADGKVEYVSGGLVIDPPDENRLVTIKSDLVLRVPHSMRVH